MKSAGPEFSQHELTFYEKHIGTSRTKWIEDGSGQTASPARNLTEESPRA